jgi:cellulose synthase/poly-beta-1,6-N-acetylglucosamine synthase-like glycosyltransferase
MSLSFLILAVILLLLELLMLARILLARKGHDQRGDSPLEDVSVVIPLKGWDRGLPNLVRHLLGADYPAEVQVILVMDPEHPHRDELPEDARFEVLHPEPAPEGWRDKNWRLRQGIERARRDLILFMDSDVRGDPTMLRDRVRFHQGDFSFAIPLYASPGNRAERYLSACTSMSNFFLYRAAFGMKPIATAIGPSMLLSVPRDVLIESMEEGRGAMTDDHALGVHLARRGHPPHCVAEPVVVTKHGASWQEVWNQMLRWALLPSTVTELMSASLTALVTVGMFLNTMGLYLLVAGLALAEIYLLRLLLGSGLLSWLTGFEPHMALLLAAGASMLLIDSLALVWVEHAFAHRRQPRRPWRHLIWAPLWVLSLPALMVMVLIRRRFEWRGDEVKVTMDEDHKLKVEVRATDDR